MPLFLNRSLAHKQFKLMLGSANHLLITVLVGLHAVETRLITSPPTSLNAAWNPQDQTASAERSRVLVLAMALVRATDALDAYFSLAQRKPAIIQDKKLTKAFDENGRTVSKRFNIVIDEYEIFEEPLIALIRVMIAWRNKSVHSLSETMPQQSDWDLLKSSDTWLTENFQGLKFDRLLTDFESDGPPTLKETTSFIRATHRFVMQLDETQVSQVEPNSYLKELFGYATGHQRGQQKTAKTLRNNVQSIWGRDPSVRLKKVISLLKNNGLSASPVDHSVEITDEMINEYASLEAKEAFEKIHQETW